MDTCDNKTYDQSEEKFSRLEKLLNISLNVFEIILLPGNNDNSKDKNEYFASSQIYSGHKSIGVLSLCILNYTQPMVSGDIDTFTNTSCTSRT